MKKPVSGHIHSGKKHFLNYKITYSIIGFLIGLLFLMAAIYVSDAKTVSQNHPNQENPLYILILATPIIFFLTGFFIGKRLDRLVTEIQQRSNEKYRKLIEEAGDVFYTADHMGNFTYFNARIKKIYGYEPEELIGKHFTSIVDLSMRTQVAEFYLSQFSQKTPETILDFKILDKKGDVRWVEQTVILLKRGTWVEGFQSIVRNTDARKLQENVIQKLNEQLREKVNELEFLNDELESFNQTVSHDLRSPLRSISTLSEMLKDEYKDVMPNGGKELLDSIIGSTQKLYQLIADLLDYSRLGKQEIACAETDMNAVVSTILHEQRQTHTHEFPEMIVHDLPSAYCDPRLIKQVWINYISNAIKYSKNIARPFIEIGAQPNEKEITYFVKDNGAGFDMKYYEKLFGVFSRLHSQNEFEGTGVGLSIVKRIVERHRGKTWATGKVKEGATFYFTLPSYSRNGFSKAAAEK